MGNFIGNEPATSFETVRKQVSTSNSGTTITLDHTVTNVQDILVTINAVVQSYDNYSVSGTTLTVGGTLSNDRVEILYVGRTFQSVNPSDSSVGTSQLVDSAVTNAKLGSDINATKLTAGLVPTARLGSGTASSSTFLRGDQTYAAAGGGNLELITTSSTTSGTSTVTIDNIFSTTYFVYKIFIRYLRPQTNDTAVRMTIIKNNGDEYTSSAYKLVHMRVRSDGYDIHEDDNQSYFKLNQGTYNSEQQGGANFDMTCNLMRTATNDDPAFTLSYLSATARNNNEGQFITGGGYVNGKNSDLNPRGIKLFMSSGNIDRMFVSVYGLKGSV